MLRRGVLRSDDRLPGVLPGRLLLTRPRTVLFVCVENACRSLLAEAFFNEVPTPGWRAISAGTAPARAPNPRAVAALRDAGVATPRHPPRALTSALLRSADRLVTMGCLPAGGCPAGRAGVVPVDWGLPDPATLDEAGFRAVVGTIRRNVDGLRTELAGEHRR